MEKPSAVSQGLKPTPTCHPAVPLLGAHAREGVKAQGRTNACTWSYGRFPGSAHNGQRPARASLHGGSFLPLSPSQQCPGPATDPPRSQGRERSQARGWTRLSLVHTSSEARRPNTDTDRQPGVAGHGLAEGPKGRFSGAGGPRKSGVTDTFTVWIVMAVAQCTQNLPTVCFNVCQWRCEQREHGDDDNQRGRHHRPLGKLSEIAGDREGCAPYLLSADDVPLTCWVLGTQQ